MECGRGDGYSYSFIQRLWFWCCSGDVLQVCSRWLLAFLASSLRPTSQGFAAADVDAKTGLTGRRCSTNCARASTIAFHMDDSNTEHSASSSQFVPGLEAAPWPILGNRSVSLLIPQTTPLFANHVKGAYLHAYRVFTPCWPSEYGNTLLYAWLAFSYPVLPREPLTLNH